MSSAEIYRRIPCLQHDPSFSFRQFSQEFENYFRFGEGKLHLREFDQTIKIIPDANVEMLYYISDGDIEDEEISEVKMHEHIVLVDFKVFQFTREISTVDDKVLQLPAPNFATRFFSCSSSSTVHF